MTEIILKFFAFGKLSSIILTIIEKKKKKKKQNILIILSNFYPNPGNERNEPWKRI